MKYYLLNFLNPSLISKFFLSSLYYLPSLHYLCLRINLIDLKEDIDLRILDSLEILFFLSNQRPKISYLVYGYKKGVRTVRFSCKVSLRKKKMEMFFSYFLKCFFYARLHSKFFLNKKFDKFNNCFFFISNLNFFKGLPEELYFYKDPIFFEIYFDLKKMTSSKYLVSLYKL